MRHKLISVLLIGLFGMIGGHEAYAHIPDSLAIKALAGEAGGQSSLELLAHAFALRNRDSLEGVYGLRANTSKLATYRARIAWNRAKSGLDITHGSTHWLSDYDLAHSRPALIAWRKKALSQIKIGDTTFYRMRHPE